MILRLLKLREKQFFCLGYLMGHGGSRASEYLKEHLFENLTKHPQFLKNTKLAISETYQQTDKEFLESEKDTFRDDVSTASTAVLVGNHLYVANVGDSRTIISKNGKQFPFLRIINQTEVMRERELKMLEVL
nr:probable protein phosphatase 2C 76 [Ipomoea batatas]